MCIRDRLRGIKLIAITMVHDGGVPTGCALELVGEQLQQPDRLLEYRQVLALEVLDEGDSTRLDFVRFDAKRIELLESGELRSTRAAFACDDLIPSLTECWLPVLPVRFVSRGQI